MNTNHNEVWKAVPGYVGKYEVSDQGRVRSLSSRFGLRKAPLVMKPDISKGKQRDYLAVKLWKNGKQKKFLVHRLVMMAFEGEIPEGMHVRHMNNNPMDNRRSNLSVGTASENQMDKWNHGTMTQAKLKEAEVMIIRELYNLGVKGKALAALFEISERYAEDLAKEKRRPTRNKLSPILKAASGFIAQGYKPVGKNKPYMVTERYSGERVI